MPCSQRRNALLKTVQMASLPISLNPAERPLVSALQPELPGLSGHDAGTRR